MSNELDNTQNQALRRIDALWRIIDAQAAIIGWYEDDHERWGYEDDDLPPDLLDAEQNLIKANAQFARLETMISREKGA